MPLRVCQGRSNSCRLGIDFPVFTKPQVLRVHDWRVIITIRLPIALVLAMSATACATMTSLSGARANPGYRCSLERRGDFGVISAEFEVSRATGAAPAYVRWDAGNGDFQNPWVTAAWFLGPGGRFSIDNGYVSIMRHIFASDRRTSRELALALTAAARVPRYSRPLLASDFQRSGSYHFHGDWTEVSALARGASELHLIAFNRDRELVDDVVIDRAIFDRAAPHVQAALREVDQMIADPAPVCTAVEDLRDDDILVT